MQVRILPAPDDEPLNRKFEPAGNPSGTVSENDRDPAGLEPFPVRLSRHTNTATGQSLCPNVSSAAAVNQAIADGVVDAINFSIGGGTSPWTDAVSLAFLNATDAGIYVAASQQAAGARAGT